MGPKRLHKGPGPSLGEATATAATAAEHSQPSQPPTNVRREKISRKSNPSLRHSTPIKGDRSKGILDPQGYRIIP